MSLIIRIAANYNIQPFIEKMTPNGEGKINDVSFVTGQEDSIDGLVVLNYSEENIEANINENLLLAFFQEPGDFPAHFYMFFYLLNYKRVYSPLKPIIGRNHIASHGFLPWHITYTFDYLTALKPFPKSKMLSCISSNKRTLRGHEERYRFIEYLKENNVGCDFFGKGYKFIDNKEDGLIDYRYSIAIENSDKENYFTEKILDCFLTYTVPIYFGCKNIDDYFPKGSFIKIDINNYDEAYDTILKTIRNDDYQSRIDALTEARNLVLNDYNLFYKISEECITINKNTDYENSKKHIRIRKSNRIIRYFFISFLKLKKILRTIFKK